MSKNIVIQENGVAQTLNTISRVVTSGQPHGSVDWVPEDETHVGEITIKANGDYPASASGLYAFSKVTVNAKSKAIGKDKDGNWKVITTDDDGLLVDKGLPVRIEVVTPPDKTSYRLMEPIDIKGLVVKAYFEDDSEYGVINVTPDMLEPMVADEITPDEATTSSDLIDFDVPIANSVKAIANDDVESDYAISEGTGTMTSALSSKNYGVIVIAAGKSSPIKINGYGNQHSFTYNEKTVYYASIDESSLSRRYVSVSPDWANGTRVSYNESQADKIAWTMVYGDIQSGGKAIKVKWTRQDGAVLETSFNVTIHGLLGI